MAELFAYLPVHSGPFALVLPRDASNLRPVDGKLYFNGTVRARARARSFITRWFVYGPPVGPAKRIGQFRSLATGEVEELFELAAAPGAEPESVHHTSQSAP